MAGLRPGHFDSGARRHLPDRPAPRTERARLPNPSAAAAGWQKIGGAVDWVEAVGTGARYRRTGAAGSTAPERRTAQNPIGKLSGSDYEPLAQCDTIAIATAAGTGSPGA
jgi:hypothetical protein